MMSTAMDNLMAAVTEWGKAKAAYDKMLKQYKGAASCDYYIQRELGDVEDAQEDLNNALEALIDERVELKLAQKVK